jgi:hypothetical protein
VNLVLDFVVMRPKILPAFRAAEPKVAFVSDYLMAKEVSRTAGSTVPNFP